MLLAILALASANPPVTAADAAVDELVTNSVADFKTHGGLPADVRSVRLVWQKLTDGVARPVICGESLQAKGNGQWVPFAARTTSGYEQYVGNGSEHYCKASEKRLGSRDVTQLYRDRLSRPIDDPN
jgi:hypothetical protein